MVAPFALAILMDRSIRSVLPAKSSGMLGRVATATVTKAMAICYGGSVWLVPSVEVSLGHR